MFAMMHKISFRWSNRYLGPFLLLRKGFLTQEDMWCNDYAVGPDLSTGS